MIEPHLNSKLLLAIKLLYSINKENTNQCYNSITRCTYIYMILLIVKMNLVLMNIKLLNHFDINFRNKECNFLHC